MTDTRLDAIREVALFAAFDAAELADLAELFVEVEHRKGDTLWEEGDEGTSFLVVLAGALDVRAGGRVVGHLGPGDFVGETALLLGDARTATVTAARTTRVLELPAEAFAGSFAQNAKVLEHLAQVLSRRLVARNRDDRVERPVTVIGVTGEPGIAGRSLVAAGLVALLTAEGCGDALLVRLSRDAVGASPIADVGRPGRIVDEGPFPSLSVRAPTDGATEPLVRGLDALADELAATHPLVVVDVGSDVDAGAAVLAQTCDVLVELVRAPRPPAVVGAATHAAHTRIHEVLNLHDAGTDAVPVNRCEPFVLPVDLALVDREPAEQVARIVADPWGPVARPLGRLARKILGRTIGIALGGGAAFGIAHVGVLRVLEEAGVPIDVVVGTSMGSIIALGYAGGLRPAVMEEIAGRIGNVRTVLSALDVTFTRPGLLRGDRLVSIFGPLLGSVQTFEQLLVPAQTVATDIESGERVCIGTGRLDAAFRASSSVPMIWAPVRRDGRTLVDGAMVDPVPAEVVRELGADRCIAVNVVPQLRKGVTTALQRAYQRVNAFNPLSYTSGSRDMPNVFDLVMNSMQSLQYELGHFKAISADVRVNVDLAEFTWVDFHRALALIDRGSVAATEALPEILRMRA